ncbi:hypothetical protein TNCV_4401641 [Trichonephila clavipes]|nr:hypothetical protein TNCV_4401641 [Trichonephila clavipes]
MKLAGSTGELNAKIWKSNHHQELQNIILRTTPKVVPMHKTFTPAASQDSQEKLRSLHLAGFWFVSVPNCLKEADLRLQGVSFSRQRTHQLDTISFDFFSQDSLI